MSRYRHWTIEEIRTRFDWSNTKPDMRDRVTRAIESQQETIAACTGSLERAQSITWCDNGYLAPLDAGNFRFDAGGWACDDESVIAVRIHDIPAGVTDSRALERVRFPYGYGMTNNVGPQS